MRRDMRRNLAIQCISKLICPAGRRRTARKVAGTALCAPFDFRQVRFQNGRQSTRLVPLIVRFVTPLNGHEDNR
ncbi:hypothetical protein ACVIW0_000181 [Bradyrhizobium sp. USDA 4454]